MLPISVTSLIKSNRYSKEVILRLLVHKRAYATRTIIKALNQLANHLYEILEVSFLASTERKKWRVAAIIAQIELSF